jgi:hypothetical protein
MTGQMRFHLPLVVGVEHIVEVEALLGEVLAKAVPDDNDLRVISNCAHQ